MSIHSIYKTEHGKDVLLDIYDRQLAQLDVAYDMQNVVTRFGDTNVLVVGSNEKKKLLIFHGGNSLNPYNLKFFLPLLKTFQIFAPDTIGHPGYSAQKTLSSKDYSYGQWAADVISGLNFESANCIGISYGGGILVKLATYAPHLINKGAFVVPSGIANCSLLKIIAKLGLPMIRYQLLSNRENLIQAIEPMTNSKEIDEDTLEMIEAVFKHVKVKAEMPKNATKKELKNYSSPTLVIAAENDVLFPGEAVISRSREIFPNLIKTELLKESPHLFFQKKTHVESVNNLIANFFH